MFPVTINIFAMHMVYRQTHRYNKAYNYTYTYRGADKPLARPTSRYILFDGQNISFDASLVIYMNSTNIPPIMIINRIYETQNLLSLQIVSFLVGLRTYQHTLYMKYIAIFPCGKVSCQVGPRRNQWYSQNKHFEKISNFGNHGL